jgi:hypothetical protein
MSSVEATRFVLDEKMEGAFRLSSMKTEVASQPQPSESLDFPLSLLDATAYLVVSKMLENLLGTHLQKRRRLHKALVRLRDAKMRRDAVTESCRVVRCIWVYRKTVS